MWFSPVKEKKEIQVCDCMPSMWKTLCRSHCRWTCASLTMPPPHKNWSKHFLPSQKTDSKEHLNPVAAYLCQTTRQHLNFNFVRFSRNCSGTKKSKSLEAVEEIINMEMQLIKWKLELLNLAHVYIKKGLRPCCKKINWIEWIVWQDNFNKQIAQSQDCSLIATCQVCLHLHIMCNVVGIREDLFCTLIYYQKCRSVPWTIIVFMAVLGISEKRTFLQEVNHRRCVAPSWARPRRPGWYKSTCPTGEPVIRQPVMLLFSPHPLLSLTPAN